MRAFNAWQGIERLKEALATRVIENVQACVEMSTELDALVLFQSDSDLLFDGQRWADVRKALFDLFEQKCGMLLMDEDIATFAAFLETEMRA